jgi:hypothetical protein
MCRPPYGGAARYFYWTAQPAIDRLGDTGMSKPKNAMIIFLLTAMLILQGEICAHAGDDLTLNFNIPSPGTYDLTVRWRVGPGHADTRPNLLLRLLQWIWRKDHLLVQASINGRDVGSPFNAYNKEIGYKEFSLGRVMITKPGNQTISFTVKKINPKNTAYSMYPAAIRIVPTDSK